MFDWAGSTWRSRRVSPAPSATHTSCYNSTGLVPCFDGSPHHGWFAGCYDPCCQGPVTSLWHSWLGWSCWGYMGSWRTWICAKAFHTLRISYKCSWELEIEDPSPLCCPPHHLPAWGWGLCGFASILPGMTALPSINPSHNHPHTPLLFWNMSIRNVSINERLPPFNRSKGRGQYFPLSNLLHTQRALHGQQRLGRSTDECKRMSASECLHVDIIRNFHAAFGGGGRRKKKKTVSPRLFS